MCEVDAAVLAGYWPQGFCIELIDHEFASLQPGLENLELTNKVFSTFMHEVAHLVQDRGSFRGVIDFMDMWDRATAVGQHVQACNGRVLIPLFNAATGITRLGDQLRWAGETSVLRSLREPRTDWFNEQDAWAFKSYDRREITTFLAGREITAPDITVHFINNVNGQTYSHELGAWEIKEAYSIAVGLIHGGPLPALENDRFEYLAVERIISSYFGDVRPQQVVALCHWTLQDLSPVNSLFELCEHFESEGGLPDEFKIYRTARDEISARDFERNCRDVIANIRDYQQQYAEFDATVSMFFQWFADHAERLLSIQLDLDRYFPLDTPLCQPIAAPNRTRDLTTLFSEVEVPIVMLPGGRFFSIGGDREDASTFAFFSFSLLNLLSELWVGSRTTWACPLHAGCRLPMKDDSTCLSEPWKKTTLQPTCPYGAAAKILRLDSDLHIAVEPLN